MQKALEIGSIISVFVFVVCLLGLLFFYGNQGARSNLDEQQHNEENSRSLERKDPSWSVWHRTRNDPIALFTLFLMVFTAVLAAVGVMQIRLLFRAETVAEKSAKAAEAAASTAKKSLIAAQRPWIIVDPSIGGPLTYSVNGLSVTLRLTLKNVGRSPAKNVWVDGKLLAPAIGIDQAFNPGNALNELVENLKNRPAVPWGHMIFPNTSISYEHTWSVSKEELERITAEVKFLHLTVIAAATYYTVFDDVSHQTGFAVGIRRKDKPRPKSDKKNRSRTAIFIDDGDMTEEDLQLIFDPTVGGYAD